MLAGVAERETSGLNSLSIARPGSSPSTRTMRIFPWVKTHKICPFESTANIERLVRDRGQRSLHSDGICCASKRFGAGLGWHTSTDEEIARFERHHPIGSKPRPALAVFRYLGVRLRCRQARQSHGVCGNGRWWHSYEAIRFKVTKGSARKPQPGKSAAEAKWLVAPILPELREILTATPSGSVVNRAPVLLLKR